MYRILYLSYHTSPLVRPGCKTAGGMNIVLNCLSSHLSDLGHEVRIITSHESKDPKIVDINGFRVVSLPKTNFKDLINEFVEDFNPHIVHLHYWMSGKYTDSLFGKYPIVVSFHTLGIPKKLLGFHVDTERIRYERLLVNLCDAIITSSSCERQDIIDHYDAEPLRVTTINFGVDFNLFHPIPKEIARKFLGISSKFILYAGRLVPEKGLHVLLNALKKLSMDIKLVIVGGTKEEIEEFKSKHWDIIKGETRIVFKGQVEHSHMPFYYSAAECVVTPSLYESFGLVALESMACGTPVIASSTGGLSALIRHNFNGYLFERGNVEDLVQKLHKLLENDDKARIMGKRAQEKALRYNWHDTVNRYLQVYGAVIRGTTALQMSIEPCMESLPGTSF